MRKKIATGFIAVIFFFPVFAQNNILSDQRLKVFIDCSNSWCDLSYIRTEINIVDFLLDNKAADVHTLITSITTGGGSSQYQLIFFGQNQFKNQTDTLRFTTNPLATESENREVLIKYLKLGLMPFIVKTSSAKGVKIDMKQADSQEGAKKETLTAPTKDPWNYWVFRIGAYGNFSGEKVYKGIRYNGNVSATRITDALKLSFSFYGNKNKTTYTFEDPLGVDPPFEYINNSHSYGFDHQLVKSINQHWSYGYNIGLSNSTFSNYKLQGTFGPAIEYNLFPYKESSNKKLTFRYTLDLIYNQYIDTTIYFKKGETLPGHGVNVALSFNQKWGGAFVGINYHHYFFNKLKYYNVGMFGSLNLRITGGLSFNAFIFAGLVRDQISLSGRDVSQQDILTRRRQLASNYNYQTNFGISYRFGSKLNNFVNPRFEGGDMMFY
jgi:hypothetical protein